MWMRRMGATAVLAAVAACAGGGDALDGRWERVGRPDEWVEFRPDGTFQGRSFMEADTLRGTYERRGGQVRVRSAQGHGGTLVLRDTVLMMEDGTRFRRVRG